jgi:hypothetical protein
MEWKPESLLNKKAELFERALLRQLAFLFKEIWHPPHSMYKQDCENYLFNCDV